MTEIKPYYSCAELAAMRLPGLPTDPKNMREKANREGWQGQKREGRGGGYEYQPPEKIMAIIRKRAADQVESERLQEMRDKLRAERKQEKDGKTQSNLNTNEVIGNFTDEGRDKFYCRFEIYSKWEEFYRESNSDGKKLGKKKSFYLFEQLYNAGQVVVEDDVRKNYPELAWETFQKWVYAYENDGMAAFCDNRNRKGRKVKSDVERHPGLEAAVIALLSEKNHIKTRHLLEIVNHLRLDKDTGEESWPELSESSLGRFRRRFEKENAQVLLAETNPDAWKNKYKSAVGKLGEDVVRLNQRWEMDGTPADWEFTDGRHTASVVLDIYTRRPMIRFSKTPRTETNKLLMREAIIDWGVPESVKQDNGSDYVSREMKVCLRNLGIEQILSAPFSPWEKGHVERFIKTYLHSVLEILDNFIGHNVAERKAIESKRTFAENLFKKNAVVKVDMTAEDMQKLTNAWIEGVYMTRKHSELGMTPFEKAASWTGVTRHIQNDRALDLLLAKPANRLPIISKKGIRYDNATFIHKLLPLPAYCGKQAEIYLDPKDYGRIIVYVEGKFVCVAECPERTGLDRQEVAAHARELQKQAVAEKRKEFKKAKRSLPMTPDQIVKDLILTRAAKAGKVEILQNRTAKHETEHLKEAERAAQAMEAPSISPEHAQILREARQMAAKATNPNPTIIEHPAQAKSTPLEGMNNEEKYKLWLDFEETVKSGMELTESWQKRFYDGYPKTSAYRAQAALYQEGGQSAGKR